MIVNNNICWTSKKKKIYCFTGIHSRCHVVAADARFIQSYIMAKEEESNDISTTRTNYSCSKLMIYDLNK